MNHELYFLSIGIFALAVTIYLGYRLFNPSEDVLDDIQNSCYPSSEMSSAPIGVAMFAIITIVSFYLYFTIGK